MAMFGIHLLGIICKLKQWGSVTFTWFLLCFQGPQPIQISICFCLSVRFFFKKVVVVSLASSKMPAAFGRLLTFKALFSISGKPLAFGSQVILALSVAISFEQMCRDIE